MRTYVMATGAIFGLLTVVHLWRLVGERHLGKDPWFLLFTALGAGFGLWALALLRPSGRT